MCIFVTDDFKCEQFKCVCLPTAPVNINILTHSQKINTINFQSFSYMCCNFESLILNLILYLFFESNSILDFNMLLLYNMIYIFTPKHIMCSVENNYAKNHLVKCNPQCVCVHASFSTHTRAHCTVTQSISFVFKQFSSFLQANVSNNYESLFLLNFVSFFYKLNFVLSFNMFLLCFMIYLSYGDE